MTAEINKAVERLTETAKAYRDYQDACVDARYWGGPTIQPRNPINGDTAGALADAMEAILSELSRLREENRRLQKAARVGGTLWGDAAEQVAMLTRERDEAREALRPFAEAVEAIDEKGNGAVDYDLMRYYQVAPSADDFRRAATLSRQSKEGGE